jgi:ubiquinone/menaquinone biosynthesis C-methylase UbiE
MANAVYKNGWKNDQMRTEWDYTNLAEAYLKRPNYAQKGLDWMLGTARIPADAKVADIGAGVGHLAIKLVETGLHVCAVEPNDRMREIGAHRTRSLDRLVWSEGTGEQTGLPSDTFELVTFGSSFNVVDRSKALAEARRVGVANAWFACMWNHRDLDDPIQKAIEVIISDLVPKYVYGTRREDQSDYLRSTAAFSRIEQFEAKIIHNQSKTDVIEAWRSHGTLHRQAGNAFEEIINRISEYLGRSGQDTLEVPYTTKLWLARFN